MTGMFHVDGEFNLPPYCKRMVCRGCQRSFAAVRQHQFQCVACAEKFQKMDSPSRGLEGGIFSERHS